MLVGNMDVGIEVQVHDWKFIDFKLNIYPHATAYL